MLGPVATASLWRTHPPAYYGFRELAEDLSPDSYDLDSGKAPEPQPILLRHRIEHGLFRVMRFALRLLPLNLSSAVSAFFWRLIAPRLKRHQRALKHLALALPALDTAQREAIAIAMWDNLGRTTVEALRIDEIALRPDAFDFAFSPDAMAVVEAGKPALFVSAHFGNWELTAVSGRLLGLDLFGIYQKLENPLVEAEVVSQRARFYPRGLAVKGQDAAQRAVRTVRAGGQVAFLADLRDHGGESVPFFELPAPSTLFPALLVRLFDLPVIAVRGTRIAPGRFRIAGERIPMVRTDDRKADAFANTAAIQACFERWIRAEPALWMWAHRRWDRTGLPQPLGEDL